MGEHGELSRLAPEDITPERFRLPGEGIAPGRVDNEPALFGEFTLELPARPASITGEEARLLESRREHFDRLSKVEQGNTANNEARGFDVERTIPVAAEGERCSDLHRATGEEARRLTNEAHPWREVAFDEFVGEGPIEDEAERPVLIVSAEEDDRAKERRLGDAEAREKELAGEGIGHDGRYDRKHRAISH